MQPLPQSTPTPSTQNRYKDFFGSPFCFLGYFSKRHAFNFSLISICYGRWVKAHVRTISYFLSIATVALIFFSVEFITEKYFYPDDEVVDILAAIVGALSFAPCKQFFDRATDKIFSRAPRDPRAEFLVNISHELQTPISILRGNVEILQRRSITDAERASAERVIISTLDGMSRVVSNVLESAKLTFSKKAGYEQNISVCALLREAHEDCSLLAEDKGIALLLEANGGAGKDLFVRGNKDRLKEVLFNLISNALKHTAPGGTITLRAEENASVATIAVEDSGSGIAPEELPHIFERFYRIAGESGVPVVPGTGIGLNICREIVEAHGGKITVKSDVGNGSRFIISLPLAPPIRQPTARSASAIINS
jgi:signal transduction histidine kinase